MLKFGVVSRCKKVANGVSLDDKLSVKKVRASVFVFGSTIATIVYKYMHICLWSASSSDFSAYGFSSCCRL